MKSNVNQKKQPEGSDPSVSGIRKGLAAANMKTGEFGMVSRVENDCVVMPIRCTVDGTLCQEEVVMPESDCRPASSEQKTVLQRLFNGRRLCWDPRKALVKVNDFQPADGERIRVSVLGEPVATGIFRHVDDQSRAVFYCLLMKNGSLRCNASEIWELPMITSSNRSVRQLATSSPKLWKPLMWYGTVICAASSGKMSLRDAGNFITIWTSISKYTGYRIPTNPATANVRRRATISQLPRKCVASRIVIWRFCDCTMVPFAEKKTGWKGQDE